MPIRSSKLRRIRRAAGRVLTVGLFLLPCFIIVLWLTFQYKPSWYRPPELDAIGMQRARNRAITSTDVVSDRMVRGRPFEVILHEGEVNEWLAVLPYAWPEVLQKLPPEVHKPVLRFEQNQIRIGAHFTARGLQAIVSLTLFVNVEEPGSTVTFSLGEVKLGAIPVPRMVLERVFADPPRKRPIQTGERPTGWSSAMEPLVPPAGIGNLLHGITLHNRFVWFNGQRPFRIESIQVTPGTLRLRLKPL